MPIGMSDASDHQIASSPCAQSDVDRAVRPADAHNIGADLTDADRLNSIPTDRPAVIVADGLMGFLTKDDFVSLLHRLIQP